MPILTLVGTGDKLLISTGNPLLVKLLCAYVQNFGRDVAQLGSALVWGTRGRWFESSRPDHFSPGFSRDVELYVHSI